ncbi:MAG: hypothetical protein WC733_04700, partial [Methylophilus sp.]
MLRRCLMLTLFSLSLLLFTPVHGEVSLNADTSLDHFSYDLDNIHFDLEKLNASWLLAPTNDNKLSINHLKVKRLTITIKPSKNNGPSSLPDKISLPLPIKITQAEVDEVLIKTKNDVQLFNNVKFSFEGDHKTLNLKSLKANTPWGDTDASLSISALKPFTLSGFATVKQAEHSTPYDISAQISGDLNKLNFNSSGLLVRLGDKLAIQQNNENTQQPIAHILTSGSIDLNDNDTISLNSSITEFHPERLGSFPDALLNLNVNVKGKLQTLPSALVEFEFHDSLWQGQALTGAGHLNIENKQIQNLDLQVAVNNNKFKASGSLGKQDSKLDWLAELPNLNALNKVYSGEVHAKGTVEGAFDNLAINLNIAAQHLLLSKDLKIDQLDGNALIGAGIDGKFEADIKASNISYGQRRVASALTSIKGTRQNHQITVSAQDNDEALNTTL